MANAEKDPYKVTTPKFRLAFASAFTPRDANKDDPTAKRKYSITMIIDKADKAEWANVGAKAQQVLIDKFGADTTKWPKGLKSPFRDGAEKTEYDGFDATKLFCSATTTVKPGIVDQERNDILDAGVLYSGCYARATINAYWYDKKGNKGVAFGLQNIQKWADGEPFAARAKASEDFDAIPLPDGTDPLAQGGSAPASTPAPAADPLGLMV